VSIGRPARSAYDVGCSPSSAGRATIRKGPAMISVPHKSTLLASTCTSPRLPQEPSPPTPTSWSSTRSPRTRSRSVASSGNSPIRATWSPATRRVRLVTSRVFFVQRCLSILPKVCYAGADGTTSDRTSPPITGTDEQPPPCPGSRPGAPAGAPGTRSLVLTEQGPQAHDFSLRSRAFPLPGGVATRLVVSPSYYDVSVGYRSAKYHYVENQKQAT